MPENDAIRVQPLFPNFRGRLQCLRSTMSVRYAGEPVSEENIGTALNHRTPWGMCQLYGSPQTSTGGR